MGRPAVLGLGFFLGAGGWAGTDNPKSQLPSPAGQTCEERPRLREEDLGLSQARMLHESGVCGDWVCGELGECPLSSRSIAPPLFPQRRLTHVVSQESKQARGQQLGPDSSASRMRAMFLPSEWGQKQDLMHAVAAGVK